MCASKSTVTAVVGDIVGDAVSDTVGDTVGETVGASVGAVVANGSKPIKVNGKGRYSTASTASNCTECETGKYQTESGKSYCSECAAGSITDTGRTAGATKCTACDAGKYSTSSNVSACIDCALCEAGQQPTGCGGSTAGYCADCIPGQYIGSSTSPCIDCPAGKYSSSTNEWNCTECETGRYQKNGGQSYCDSCPSNSEYNTSAQACKCSTGYVKTSDGECEQCIPGKHFNSTSRTCRECLAGYYQPTTNEPSCDACETGKYQTESGKSYCSECAAGSITDTGRTAGATKCTACDAGKYSTSSNVSACIDCALCEAGQQPTGCGGSTAGYCADCIPGQYIGSSTSPCIDCPAGKYSSSTNEWNCAECGAGTYQAKSGQSYCDSCPSNSKYNADTQACECSRGYFMRIEEQVCQVCPANSDCRQAGFTLHTLEPAQGHWRATNVSLVFHQCPNVLHGLRENFERRASKFRILVGFTQVLSRVPVTFRLTFPPIVTDFLHWLDVFEFLNIFHFAFTPNCLHSLDYYDRLMARVLGPAITLALAYIGHQLTRQQWMYEVFLLLSFVCYPAFCDSLFRFFDCREYEDGERYLVIDPSVRCTDEKYIAYVPVVTMFSIVLPFGIIAIYFYELISNRQLLRPRVYLPSALTEEELAKIPRATLRLTQPSTPAETNKAQAERKKALDSEGSSSVRAVLQPQQMERGVSLDELDEEYEQMKRKEGKAKTIEWLQILVRDTREDARHLDFLTNAYRPMFYWFEGLEMLRKFLLTGFPLLTRLLSPGSNSESVWGTVLMALIAFYISRIQPYVNSEDQGLAMPVHLQLIITMVAGMGNEVMASGGDAGAGRDIFVAFLVIGTALPVLLVLMYRVIDPNNATALAKRTIVLYQKMQANSRGKLLWRLRAVLQPGLPNGADGVAELAWQDLERFVEGIKAPDELRATVAELIAVIRHSKTERTWLMQQIKQHSVQKVLSKLAHKAALIRKEQASAKQKQKRMEHTNPTAVVPTTEREDEPEQEEEASAGQEIEPPALAVPSAGEATGAAG
eukprot:g904.t1